MSTTESVRIGESVDIETVRGRIGVGQNEELRSSSRRRNYLQKFSRVMTGVSLDLKIVGDRAETQWEEDPPEVFIPGEKNPQPVTDLPSKIWDLLSQETIALHEIGHILYTDFPTFVDLFYDLPENERGIFLALMNVLEDGAIESQLRAELSVEEDFLVLYANLVQTGGYGTPLGSGVYAYTFHEAAITFFSDMGTYRTGRAQKLMDPSNSSHIFAGEAEDRTRFLEKLPRLKQVAANVLSEPDGTKRLEIIREFFEEYKEWVESAEAGGKGQANSKSDEKSFETKPEDMVDVDAETAEDLSEGAGKTKKATDLPREDEVLEAIEAPQEGESYAGSLEDNDVEIDDLRESYASEVKREAQDVAGGSMSEVEEFLDLLDGGVGATDSNLRGLELDVVYDGEEDRQRFEQVVRRSRPLKKALSRRLQKDENNQKARNQRTGRFDNQALPGAARGDARSFVQRKRPNEKEYSVMFVLDRSGSMDRDEDPVVKTAENAVGAMCKALEDVGAETSIMDLCGNTPRLTLPYGEDMGESDGPLFTEETAGGTPLRKVVALARERLENLSTDQPFLIIVTDGKPADKEGYKNELEACNFPVLGITLALKSSNVVDAGDYFHRHREVQQKGELYRQLQMLCNQVMF